MDERGFITGYAYDIPTGAMTRMIQDVDTSLVDAPAGWVTPAGGGLHLITDYEHDDQGRQTQSLGPTHTIDLNGTATVIRRASWTVYQDADFQRWTAQGFATGDGPDYDYTLVNPVSITKMDAMGKALEQISAIRTTTAGKLAPSDTFPQSSYCRWTTNQYTDCCLAASQRVYHTIPSTGEGLPDVNYDESDYGYDVMKRQNRTVTPGGTITYRVFDTRGQVTAIYIGTNDNGATDDDPTGGGAMGNNMVVVTENEYDNGDTGGDGNLTLVTQHVDAVTARLTAYLYDWRDRQTDIDGEIDFYQIVCYDNLNRVLRTDRRNTTATGTLIGRNETKYDDQNRVFRTFRYAVNPETGAVGNSLVDNTWYDASGNTIKSKPSGAQLFTKTVYDSLGRGTISYLGYDLDETTYAEISDVSDDVILEQTERTYDDASNGIAALFRMRYHNAPDTQTGPLQDPSNDPKARVTYSASWPDAIGRSQASANYGTNGGTALTRPDTIPERSDIILVSSTDYDACGNLLDTIDASGMVTRFEYDAVGRQLAKIQNYIASNSSGSSSSLSSSSSSGSNTCGGSADVNVTVLTVYNSDGNVSSLTALNASTGDQTTQYVYGTTLADSGIASSQLKRKEIYPDSVDDDDVILFAYNRQQETTQVTDQGGTVHEFDYDFLGRQTQDRVTSLGDDVDDAVLRIETTFDVRGMKHHLTSYDSATVGTGTVVNDCQFEYNSFGQLITEYQSHSGMVDTDTTPKVQYGFANGSANTIRAMTLTYPNGRVLTYAYGTTSDIDDVAGRVKSLIDDDGTTHLVDYSYLGQSTFVVTDYLEPEVKYTLIGTAGGDNPDTGDIYWGLDRLGRIKDSYWYNYGNSTDADRIKYGYDRVGNRTYRQNLVATADSAEFDELYCYDQVHRLANMKRGMLHLTQPGMVSTTFEQCWTLDGTGNWNAFCEDDNGDSNWTFIQSRESNPVNEIAAVKESAGPRWVTPHYSRVGNMTVIPQPAMPTDAYNSSYDAWNRLVGVADTTNTVLKYRYDGTMARVTAFTYLNGMLEECRHFYCTRDTCGSKWTTIEERLGVSPDSAEPKVHNVWGLRYSDDIILRDRSDMGLVLDERIYALQDANWNVTSLANTDGVIEERFHYDPYGTSNVLSQTWAVQLDGLAWELRFAGCTYESATGLYHIRLRAMHPTVGAWLQRDPIGYADGNNLYEYCASDPINNTDPTGLFVTAPAPPTPAPPAIRPLPPVVPVTGTAIGLCIANPVICAGIIVIGVVVILGVSYILYRSIEDLCKEGLRRISSDPQETTPRWRRPRRKRCLAICVDTLGECNMSRLQDIKDDFGNSRCQSCFGICRSNCLDPFNQNPWPATVTLIEDGKVYEATCRF